MNNPLVNILGIGAPKSGTTWLFKCLEEHPEIVISKKNFPSNKELYFFDRYYHNGFDWYHGLFDDKLAVQNRLEITPTYLSDHRIPRRVYEYNSNMKLIVCLRNPIDRAYSHHKMLAGGGMYGDCKLVKFENALQQNPAYIEFGLFGKQIGNYLEYFNRESIHIIFFEDICLSPEKVIHELCEFLSISKFKPSLVREKVYQSPKKFINRNLNDSKKNPLRRIQSRLFKPDATFGISIPLMGKKMRVYLREVFDIEIKEIENLTGRDLSHWK